MWGGRQIMVGRGTRGFGRGGARGIGGEWKLKFAQLSKANWGVFGRCCGPLFTVLRAVWIETAEQRGGNAGLNGSAPGGSCVPALHRVGTGRPLSHANELACDFIYTHTRAPTRKHVPKVSICLQHVLALRSPRTGWQQGVCPLGFTV